MKHEGNGYVDGVIGVGGAPELLAGSAGLFCFVDLFLRDQKAGCRQRLHPSRGGAFTRL